MKKIRRSRLLRPGVMCVVGVLLAAMLLQILPLAFPPPFPASTAGDGREYFKPLQVCDDLSGTGLFFDDIPRISPASPVIHTSSAGEALVTATTVFLPEDFSAPVYRPPRSLSLYV